MDYKRFSDKQIWEYHQKGDIKAFNELFDRYVGKLHRMGLRYVKDECVVEELATDVLLDLWMRRSEIILEGQLSNYLFRAMHNKSISFLRKSVPETIDISTLPENTLVSEGKTDQYLSLKDVQSTLEEKLKQLSPQRQKVFRLSREQDMSYADIAIEMDLSPNTVRNHMKAALEYLRLQYREITLSITIILSLSLF